VVVECLAPGDEGEAGEGLGLEFEGEVEVLGELGWLCEWYGETDLNDCVYTEWDAA
jgi:hypothetical protein